MDAAAPAALGRQPAAQPVVRRGRDELSAVAAAPRCVIVLRKGSAKQRGIGAAGIACALLGAGAAAAECVGDVRACGGRKE